MHLLDRREHALAWDEHAVAARAVVQAVPAVHGLVPHLHGGLPFRALLVVLTLTSDVLFSIPPSSLGLQALEVRQCPQSDISQIRVGSLSTRRAPVAGRRTPVGPSRVSLIDANAL